VILMTIAPENVTPAQIKILQKQGVIVSLGHTNAQPEQIHAALEAGATGFTHLYNGMGGMSARAPGPAGVALDDRDSWCGIIADGHHVSAQMIRLALRAKPPGKVFLVSDAMPPAGAEKPEAFQLYGETIHIENGCCVSAEGRLAGSAITMLDAVRYCVMKVGVELDEALRMASTYPAAFLGLGKTRGKLLPGFETSVIGVPEMFTKDDNSGKQKIIVAC
jgi:N-acetylglucosamine-6-phosphate deacetylase